MKNTIILTLIALVIIPFAYAEQPGDEIECYGAGFCDGNSEILCSYTLDGYCPEDYGNWNTCKPNNYGSKCYPCDPNCDDDCGVITVSMPPNPSPSEDINIYALIFADETYYSGTGFVVFLIKDLVAVNYALCSEIDPRNCECADNLCKIRFTNMGTPATGGTLFIYDVYAPNIQSSMVSSTGITKPYIEILQPQPEQTYSGSFNLQTRASSMYESSTPEETNITEINLYLYKKTSEENYLKANPNENCASCDEEDCNLIAKWPDNQLFNRNNNIFTYLWDSSNCGGDTTEFRINSTADDLYSSNTIGVDFSLNNQGAPCINNCPKVSSSLLKLVLAKIKVGL